MQEEPWLFDWHSIWKNGSSKTVPPGVKLLAGGVSVTTSWFVVGVAVPVSV